MKHQLRTIASAILEIDGTNSTPIVSIVHDVTADVLWIEVTYKGEKLKTAPSGMKFLSKVRNIATILEMNFRSLVSDYKGKLNITRFYVAPDYRKYNSDSAISINKRGGYRGGGRKSNKSKGIPKRVKDSVQLDPDMYEYRQTLGREFSNIVNQLLKAHKAESCS